VQRTLARLSLMLLAGVVVCAIAYQLMGGQRIDRNGILREPFVFIPLGFVCLAGAALSGGGAVISAACARSRGSTSGSR
jgi:hypothetical protein